MATSEWVLLAYRLPREPSTPRISVWRKLRRVGALQLVDGLVTLPAGPDTIEAFEWLAEEVVEAGGEAWTWRATSGSKAQEQSLRQRMSAAVTEEYRMLIDEATDAAADRSRRSVARLRRELHRIESRDHISPTEREIARHAIERLAAETDLAGAEVARSMRWATRAGCHVDRAACVWLLRRFIDPTAEFMFVDDPADVPDDATPFDMRGVELSHRAGDCSFETILRRHGVDDPVLWDLARIVHEADLHDERYDEPVAAGLDTICRGLTLVANDARVLELSAAIFDGLYEHRRQLLRGDRPG